MNLLATNPQPICLDGFEPSGRMHIAQGVFKALHVRKLISAGCKVKILIADWFAFLNNKLGGDMKKITTIGEYMIEVWKAIGLDVDGVEFLWWSQEINKRPQHYWPTALDIATKNNIPRILKCSRIMGRSEQDDLLAAQIVYPCMQAADAFFFEADICQMGMDQREVNLLAREYCTERKRKNKPVALLHHILPGLLQGQEKMSTTDPSSCIFMDDEEADINVKIKKAYCPPKVVLGNPILEYVQHIILPWSGKFEVERRDGGNKTFTNFEELVTDYESEELHPADLKPALSKALCKILEPVRDHFRDNPKAKDLLKRVKSYKNTKLEPLPVNQHPQDQLLNRASDPHPLTAEERFQILTSIAEECIKEDELGILLAKKPQPICYDGFEPSGRMHIAQGVLKTINVNKLISAGCKVKILIADWFAQLNNKMGGDLEKIRTIGEYLIEIWIAMRMDVNGVEFIFSSDEINTRAAEYWPLVLDIARRNNLARILRCSQIMGRSEQDDLSAAQIFYPCMQCADIFFLKADICQLGMDQRKVNVLAREYCDDIKRKNKPIILSHHMLPGLKQGQEKMSKSDPSSSIFMEDEEAEVNAKIENAHCPQKVVINNPCLEYVEYLIFPWFGNIEIERHGGNTTFHNFKEVVTDYERGELLPADLKPALAKSLNKMLQPVRDHFRDNPKAKDLLERIRGYR